MGTVHAQHVFSIVVIGAGTAGITAAHKLKQAHQDVLVLEARNRTGGRIHTNYSWGEPIELGASWVHGVNHNPIKQLIHPKQLVKNNYHDEDSDGMLGDFALYNQLGKKVGVKELFAFKSITKNFVHSIKHKNTHLNLESEFKNYIRDKKLNKMQSDLLHYALQNIYTYEYAADLQKIGLASEAPYLHSLVGGHNALIAGGYIKILDDLTKGISIQFNQQVKKIDHSHYPIRIDTQNKSFLAKKVILTVPLGVLKAQKIQFTPTLPQVKRQAIAHLGMGNYEKIYLRFDHAFWDRDKEWIGKIPKVPNQAFNIFNLYKYSHTPVLLFFTSGQLALEKSTGSLKPWAVKQLRSIYGEKIPEPLQVLQTHWTQDPYSLGSYSYLPIQFKETLYQQIAQSISEKIYFAGEATSSTDPGTVHGAYLSGLRVAKEVLKSR